MYFPLIYNCVDSPPPCLLLSSCQGFLMFTFYLNFEGLLILQLTDSLLRIACSVVTITHTHKTHMPTVLIVGWKQF